MSAPAAMKVVSVALPPARAGETALVLPLVPHAGRANGRCETLLPTVGGTP